jgi:FkbH-like protein
MKIKLIIWDLDDTLWEGTIANDPNVKVNNGLIEIIKDLNNRGVVNTICSNNLHKPTIDILKLLKIDDLFIMPNINYESKGIRIKQIISDFQLRDENVLFIDDNDFNLTESKHYNQNINTINPKNNDKLYKILQEVKELNKIDNKKRFNHYKIIEEKVVSKVSYDSNDDFLSDSNIKVQIRPFKPSDIDRVYELVQRTNQLNYTKNRKNRDEILIDTKNNVSLVVSVSDKYGEYGDVGFVCFNEKETIHFTFSCRILNMGVVDFTYHELSIPKFDIVGDVATEIGPSKPSWIKVGKSLNSNNQKNGKKILMIGGCDLEQMAAYLNKDYNVKTYFNYTHNGIIIHRDSIDFLMSRDFSKDELKYILDTVPFVNDKCYEKPNIEGYDIIIYSPIKDYGQGKYVSSRVPNYYMSCNPFFHKKWDKKDLKSFSLGRNIALEKLETFVGEWRPVEKPINVFEGQVDKFISNLSSSSSQVFVILGAEEYYPKFDVDVFKPGERYVKFNNVVREVCDRYSNVKSICPSDFIKGPDDFTNNVRHYKRHIYKSLSDTVKLNIK